jgi:hypothetical protein
VFQAAHIGQETIIGFEAQQDQIQLGSNVVGDVATILSDAHQVGQDTVITIDANDSITLSDVAVASLSASDFLIV